MYCFQHSLSSLKNIIYYYSAVQVRTSITLKHGWPSFVVCTSLSVGIPSGFSFNHPFLYQVGTNPSCSSPSQSDISGASASKITSSLPCQLSSTTNFPFPNFSNLSRISSATSFTSDCKNTLAPSSNPLAHASTISFCTNR